MILKVNRQELLRNIRVVEKSVTENKIRPIISCIYLETSADKVFMKGTNLELTISSVLKGEVVESGHMVFPYQLVEEYLKEISDEVITLVSTKDILTIETEDSSSEFSILDADDYPRIKKFIGEESFVWDREKAAEIFEKSKFAASTSTDNLAINCVRLEIEDGVMNVVSTDTYRLVHLSDSTEYSKELKVSIPLSTVEALIKILRGSKEMDVKFSYEGTQVMFEIGAITILSRVIDLNFPDYKAILAASTHTKRVEVKIDEFIKVLKRVQIFVKNNMEAKYSAIFKFLENEISIDGSSEIAKGYRIVIL